MVSLISVLLAILCIVLTFISFTQLKVAGSDVTVTFFSTANLITACCAIFLSLVAIISGAMAGKDKDKSGPKRLGMVLGIFGIIIALISCGIASLFAEIGKYIEGKDSSISEAVKNNPDVQKQLEEFRQSLIDSAKK